MSSRFQLVVVCAALSALLFSSLSAPVFAQRRQDASKERVRIVGTLAGMKPGFLQVNAGGEQWVAKVDAKAEDVVFTGEAEKNWLRRGMLVEFTGKFNQKGQMLEPISKLTVVAPRQDRSVGLVRLFGLDRPPATAPPEEEFTSYLVVGHLAAMTEDKFTVNAGAPLQGVLADDMEISVNISDYRVAREGDNVQIDGWYVPARRGEVYATRLTITAAQPLIGETPPQKKGG